MNIQRPSPTRSWVAAGCIAAFLGLGGSTSAFAVDGHIDSATRAVTQGLTFARHVNTTITTATVDQALQVGSQLMQACDSRITSDQDVACQVTVQRNGAIGTFGTATDGLDVITTDAEMNTVVGNNVARVKVVTSISACFGTINPSIIGCAYYDISGIVSESGLGVNLMGEELVHEFGHNQGLRHRGDPGQPAAVGNPFMQNPLGGRNEVNLAECGSYHTGGADNGPKRPVDVAFIIDDTGSMTEEIGGVRDALTAHLNTYPATTCTAFQLTTFKDDVTEREPTTDLPSVQAAVAALTATGGDDCPEASVEAINQVREKIKDNGRAFVATDAAPHAGLDIAGAIAALRARGIRVDEVVSGQCPNLALAASSSNDPQAAATRVGSTWTMQTGASEASLTAVPGIEDLSQIAIETGGIFAFVPEVNSGSPEGGQYYQNTMFNITQGGITRSICLAQPPTAPQGSSTIVTLTGSGTNFVANKTTMAVAGGGVSVSDIQVISPIQLAARLTIDAGAALGFRDISATTNLGFGFSETAHGVGVLRIVSAIAAPTILGISPPVGVRGQSLTVTVDGANTHFGGGSILDLGPDVNVVGVSAPTPDILMAEIHVGSSAAIGFRDVTVTSGAEVARESLTGPFFTAAAPPALPRILSVAPSTRHANTTATLTIGAENTSFNASSIVGFSGAGINVLEITPTSPTTLTTTIQIALDAPLGFRDVRVTTGAQVAAVLGGFFVSEPLIANAGPDTTVECTGEGAGTPVRLDGTRSSPAPLAFYWSASGVTFDDPTSPTPVGLFPLGSTTVTLTVTKDGQSVQDIVVVTVVDTSPPTLTVTLSPASLWPPNHKLADVHADVRAVDACDPRPTVKLESIASSEPDDGTGDGDAPNDIQGAELGTLDVDFELRAERSAKGSGRTYIVCYEVTDASGNVTRACARLVVPHDEKARAAMTAGKRGWGLVIFGDLLMAAEKIESASVALGTDDFKSIQPSVQAPDVVDFDVDGYLDAVLWFSAEEQADVSAALATGVVFARWEAGEYGYLASIAPTPVTGVPVSAQQERFGAYVNPNPAGPWTTIRYGLPSDGHVRLEVFDVGGRLICRLANEVQGAGRHETRFESSSGRAGSQVYYYRLQWQGRTLEGSFVLVR